MTNWMPVADAAARGYEDEAIGVGIIGPDGENWSQLGDQQFPAASTVKIPLMIEIYRMFDAGKVSPTDVYQLTAEDKTPGSGVLQHLHDDLEITLNDLIYLMIGISDNTATNILIDKAGMQPVNDTMQALGMEHSRLARKMVGRSLTEEDQAHENWAAPNDYAKALQAILSNEAASKASCQAMIEMLMKQHIRSRTGRYVPQIESVRWGSKTGWRPGIVNDVGFIQSPAGTLIVSVFCRNMSDDDRGELLIAEITRAAMEVTGVAEPL